MVSVPVPMPVSIKSVNEHERFQPRVEMNDDHVKQIVDALIDNNNALDDKPIHCWIINQKLYVVDGHHRLKALGDKRFKFLTVDVITHETERPDNMSDDDFTNLQMSDALKFAIQANNHHGSPLKRSQADNRRAITLLLESEQTRKLSDSKIAELCAVSGPTVAAVRKSKPDFASETRVTSDGRTISHTKQSSGVLARVPVVVSHQPDGSSTAELTVQDVVDCDSESVQPTLLVHDSSSVCVDFNASCGQIASVISQSLTPDRLIELVAVLRGLCEPAVVPSLVVPSPDKRRRFDWSNLEGVRESMAISQGVKNSRFTKWYNDFRVESKRTKFPNLPDDEVLKSMWSDLNRPELTGSTLEQSA